MHEFLLPTLYTLSGISFYATLHHGLIGIRRPIEQMQLLFALICLSISLYILTKTWAYKAVTVHELVEVRRWEVVLVCILFYLLPSRSPIYRHGFTQIAHGIGNILGIHANNLLVTALRHSIC